MAGLRVFVDYARVNLYLFQAMNMTADGSAAAALQSEDSNLILSNNITKGDYLFQLTLFNMNSMILYIPARHDCTKNGWACWLYGVRLVQCL